MLIRIELCSSLLAMGLIALTTAGCGNDQAPAAKTAPIPLPAQKSPPGAALTGAISVDGSSTVFPVSKKMAEAFQQANPSVKITVEESGTGGGFKKFCAGERDIIGASRPINGAEARQCSAQKIDYIELAFAFDNVTVVVNPRNAAVDCLTVQELKTLWEPAAEGKIKQWNQVRPSFGAQPLVLFGPGKDSGTFDFFTLAIVGTESQSRSDYTKSEDDTVLVQGVAADQNALGYFGYSYYQNNLDKLKLVAIDNGKGCVLPSVQTATDASYQPLSRPLFIYVKQAAAARPEVQAFAQFYIAPENAKLVTAIGAVPLPPAALLVANARLSQHATGSALGGHGSVIGLTQESFMDKEKLESALVR